MGIYVPPGTSGVTIFGATVSGANDHGIMAENTTHLAIQNSTIQDNGLNPTANIDTNKAVLLVGVTDSSVENNTVTGTWPTGASASPTRAAASTPALRARGHNS